MNFKPEFGHRVRVYWNTRLSCFSVQKYSLDLHRWHLWYHCDQVSLKNCQFKVWEESRKRCLREGRKNVHAFVIGTLIPTIPCNQDKWQLVRYNPYECGSFTKNGIPIHGAYWTYLERGSIYLVA